MTIKTNDPLIEQFAQTFARIIVDLSRSADKLANAPKAKPSRKPIHKKSNRRARK